MRRKGALAFVGVLTALLAAFALSDLALAQQAASATPSGDGKDFISNFDKDKDGKVSKAEFEELFKKLDASGDGFIEASELPQGPPRKGPPRDRQMGRFEDDCFPGMPQGQRQGPPMMERKGGMKDFMADLDADKDGKVSKDEFKGPDELFTKLDKSGDGFIDSKEAPKGPPMGKSKRAARPDGPQAGPFQGQPMARGPMMAPMPGVHPPCFQPCVPCCPPPPPPIPGGCPGMMQQSMMQQGMIRQRAGEQAEW